MPHSRATARPNAAPPRFTRSTCELALAGFHENVMPPSCAGHVHGAPFACTGEPDEGIAAALYGTVRVAATPPAGACAASADERPDGPSGSRPPGGPLGAKCERRAAGATTAPS